MYFYYYGKPYEIRTELISWKGFVQYFNDYKGIEIFMTRKDLYKRINVNVITRPIENKVKYSFGCEHIFDDGHITVSHINPRDQIMKGLKILYNKPLDIKILEVINNIEDEYTKQSLIDSLGEISNCTINEIQEIINKVV